MKRLPTKVFVIAVALQAHPVHAGTEQACAAQLEMVEAIVDARNKGIDKKLLIATTSPTLPNPDTRNAVIQAIDFVYGLDRKKLPLAAKMVYKICLALPSEGGK